MLCSSYGLGILVPPIFRMMSVVNFGQATSAIDFSSKLEEMFSTHEEILSYELGRVLSSLEHFYSEWVATLCSIAAFRWCRFLVDQRTSINRSLAGFAKKASTGAARSIFGPEAESFSLGSVAADHAYFGAGDIEVWLGPGTFRPKIPVARLALNQKNWQAGRRILISHQRWHHDTKWRDFART